MLFAIDWSKTSPAKNQAVIVFGSKKHALAWTVEGD